MVPFWGRSVINLGLAGSWGAGTASVAEAYAHFYGEMGSAVAAKITGLTSSGMELEVLTVRLSY